MAQQKVHWHFRKRCKVRFLWNFRWSPFIKKGYLCYFPRGRLALNWKEGNVMRLLSFERMIDAGAVSPKLYVLCVWNVVDKLETVSAFPASAYLPWFKNPLAISIFIYLIPPTEAHQQSPGHILRTTKEITDAPQRAAFIRKQHNLHYPLSNEQPTAGLCSPSQSRSRRTAEE